MASKTEHSVVTDLAYLYLRANFAAYFVGRKLVRSLLKK